MAEREPPNEELPPDEGDGEELIPDPPDDEEIKDPFERETIRYAADERLLGVTLDGPKVGRRSIDVFFLGEFLAQLDRVVRALTAAAEGLDLGPVGKIPRPPDAAPWRTRALAFGNSATLEFELGEGETTKMDNDGSVTTPTTEAVASLGQLVHLDAEEAVERVREFDDRIGTDFSALLGLLADNDLTSKWAPIQSEPVAVPADQADRVRNALRRELEPATGVVTVTGFLFRLDAKRDDFRLQPEEGGAITGSYDESLISDLRDAWSHRVVAELRRTEHRYAYATRPHRVEHALVRIVRKLGRVEGGDEA